jgi:glycine/D-amino acid oxidase-like deaminating enzyme
MGGGIMGL